MLWVLRPYVLILGNPSLDSHDISALGLKYFCHKGIGIAPKKLAYGIACIWIWEACNVISYVGKYLACGVECMVLT